MDEYYRATSVADACEELAPDAERDVELIAGGQTLTLQLRQGLKDPDRLVDVSGLEALTGIREDGDAVRIGGAVTYADLGDSELIRREFPYFADAIEEIAGPQVRANGTVGGGLCHGDPALDTPPVLLTLDAELTLRSRDGERTLPLSEFYTGYYETARRPDEILTGIAVPKLPPDSRGVYRTMTPRQGDYAVAGVAARITFEGDAVGAARLALTNGGDTPKRAREAETELEGSTLDADAVDGAVAALRGALDLIGDEQVSKSYQETVFQRLARQSIRDLRDRGDAEGDGR